MLVTRHSNYDAIAVHANQLFAVAVGWAGQDAASHQRDLRAVAGAEVPEPEAVPDLMRDGALLPFGRHLREPGVVDGDLTGGHNLGTRRVRNNPQVVVKTFNYDRGRGEPQPPQRQRNQYHVLQHAPIIDRCCQDHDHESRSRRSQVPIKARGPGVV